MNQTKRNYRLRPRDSKKSLQKLKVLENYQRKFLKKKGCSFSSVIFPKKITGFQTFKSMVGNQKVNKVKRTIVKNIKRRKFFDRSSSPDYPSKSPLKKLIFLKKKGHRRQRTAIITTKNPFLGQSIATKNPLDKNIFKIGGKNGRSNQLFDKYFAGKQSKVVIRSSLRIGSLQKEGVNEFVTHKKISSYQCSKQKRELETSEGSQFSPSYGQTDEFTFRLLGNQDSLLASSKSQVNSIHDYSIQRYRTKYHQIQTKLDIKPDETDQQKPQKPLIKHSESQRATNHSHTNYQELYLNLTDKTFEDQTRIKELQENLTNWKKELKQKKTAIETLAEENQLLKQQNKSLALRLKEDTTKIKSFTNVEEGFKVFRKL